MATTTLPVIRISSLSREYVPVSVRIYENGQIQDPTVSIVTMAFPLPGVEPGEVDWKAATWETVDEEYFYAKCLIGPGGTITLSDGTYDIWVKIADSPENIVRKVGRLIIF